MKIQSNITLFKNICLSLIGFCIVNISYIYLIHLIGHNHFGDLALSLAILFSLVPICLLGTSILTKEKLPKYHQNKESAKKNILIK